VVGGFAEISVVSRKNWCYGRALHEVLTLSHNRATKVISIAIKQVLRCDKVARTRPWLSLPSARFTYRLYRLSLGPHEPRGPPTKCGTHRVNGSFGLNFVKNLCFNYYSRNLVSFSFRGDNARVFQRVSMNLNMTVGQAAHTKYCVDILKARWLRPAFAESYRLLRMTL